MKNRRIALLTAFTLLTAVTATGCDLSQWLADCSNSLGFNYSWIACGQIGAISIGGLVALIVALLGGMVGAM